jgi:hypothetical protein
VALAWPTACAKCWASTWSWNAGIDAAAGPDDVKLDL